MPYDDFTAAYIEAMLWTECNSDNEELDGCDIDDFAPAAVARIVEHCKVWQDANAALLAQAYEREGYGGPEQAGHDFWLTRNGHGAGFWDRDALDADGLGDALTKACEHSPCCLYKGDDGLVYYDIG